MPCLPHVGNLLPPLQPDNVWQRPPSYKNLVLTLAADIIQDLYLRELRAYKPPAVKATDAEGLVHKFNMPKPPKSPEETSMANQVQEYESSAVEVEGQASTEQPQESEEDYFEDLKAYDD